MKTQILAAAAVAALFALGTVARADDTQQVAQAPTQIAQGASTCSPAADPAIPLALWVTATAITPVLPTATFGANMRGACIGTAQFVPASQPFFGVYPYPASWYVFGPYPAAPYRGN